MSLCLFCVLCFVLACYSYGVSLLFRVYAALPCSPDDMGPDDARHGEPMNVLISGDLSLLSCRLAEHLLREGHRVTLMQHVDHDLSVPTEDSGVITDILNELSKTENRFSIRSATTCTPESVSKQASPETLGFSHVVFVGTALHGSGSPSAFVRHSLGCLSTLLEATRRDNPALHFTLVVKAPDAVSEMRCGNENVGFASVMESSMAVVLRLSWSLYGTIVKCVKLSPDISVQISTVSPEASLVVKEVVSTIVDSMQRRPWCEDIHIVDAAGNSAFTDRYLMMWSRLPSWTAPSDSPAERVAAEGEDVVFSTYLTSKKDPQRRVFVKENNYNYVSDWYLSMRDIGIKAVVFHDGLSTEFRCVRHILSIFLTVIDFMQSLMKQAFKSKRAYAFIAVTRT